MTDEELTRLRALAALQRMIADLEAGLEHRAERAEQVRLRALPPPLRAGQTTRSSLCRECGADIREGYSYVGLCVVCAEALLSRPTASPDLAAAVWAAVHEATEEGQR